MKAKHAATIRRGILEGREYAEFCMESSTTEAEKYFEDFYRKKNSTLLFSAFMKSWMDHYNVLADAKTDDSLDTMMLYLDKLVIATMHIAVVERN